MSNLPNIDVVYYSKTDLASNSSLYYPNKKDNNSILDICYLQQVKANLYNQSGNNIGIIQILNNFRSDDFDGLNTGFVNLKTPNGIITFINTYGVGSSTEPYIPNIIEFMKAVYVSGVYAKNGLEVYIKLTRLNDPNLTRKLEIFYN
jgi:hypothetical protein